MTRIIALFVVLSLVAGALGQDPADSWLAYTVDKGDGALLTYINATWVVPSNPTSLVEGNAPGWWFGIEPVPADDLIQPILAWGYTGVEYSIFNGYFQWDDGYWWSSDTGTVKPGQTIFGEVRYNKANGSYDMLISCKETGFSVSSNIAIEQGKTYTDAYFVVEHQPNSCDEYPSNGQIVFTNINVERNYVPVTPNWQAFQYQPACDSTATVVSSTSVKFTWSASANASNTTQIITN